LYTLVEQTPATVLLECAPPNPSALPADALPESLTRLFTAPLQILEARQPAEIPTLFAAIETAIAAGHFAAGYFAYECGSFFEPTTAAPPQSQLLAWIAIYPHPYVFNHRSGAFLGAPPPNLCRFQPANQHVPQPHDPSLQPAFALTEPEYAQRIAAIHKWIRSGDIYQLNFTAPMQLQAPPSSAALYAHLRARQPVEFGAFLHCQPQHRILSFSPELFFRVENHGATRHITTRPMKGTAPRGRTTTEDRQHADWLRNDEKNRAENLMIVDLLRNDLGRLARFGTVRVPHLFAVERYRTLWQMTSTVTAELRPDVGFQQIFRAMFPCGSITGAPKVRAMQLIAEIEQQPRGVYTGAIGFFSPERTIFSVAIRTLELDGAHGKMGLGSGIVIDSVAADEFRECLLKAEFLTNSADRFPAQFSLVETLLWRTGFPLIELHLDRLQDSAHYFGFPCDRTAIQAVLVAHAAHLPAQHPHKVRLLLSSDGHPSISSQPLLHPAGNLSPVRLCIAREQTDPADPMLFHKTTHRPLYAKAFKAASNAGYDDVLFLNHQGELTEGAISNVFVEKDGLWSTPPVHCGLLAGVQRRRLLQTQPGIQERVLHLDDLRRADAIYIANAVRGLRRAQIDWEE
jgi:para-aminobenzoate synthetase/4-amino-4-deoxychorismate lyase